MKTGGKKPNAENNKMELIDDVVGPNSRENYHTVCWCVWLTMQPKTSCFSNFQRYLEHRQRKCDVIPCSVPRFPGYVDQSRANNSFF